MGKLSELGRGFNVGGWLSQSDLSERHMRSFISADDFRQMADWGFENVRIPFDYELIKDPDNPGSCREDGLAWLDTALGWAEQAGLKAVLDMHKAPGFVFTMMTKEFDGPIPLISDASVRRRWLELWRRITERYRGRFGRAAFELLNEITAPDPADWNDLAAAAFRAIRDADADRTVVIGTNMWNSAAGFPDLEPVEDDNVIYTFHFYDPIAFTHQRARWMPEMVYYGRTVPYPGRPPELRETADRAAAEGNHFVARRLGKLADLYGDRGHDRDMLREFLAPALEFRDANDAEIYCGEFGVVHLAPDEDRLRWFRDTLELFDAEGIGWSVWAYKGMGFGVVANDGTRHEQMLAILRGRA
ncbi:MAG: glycoside hydrolase family 5 protein [Planctomycetota bacterium]